VTVCAIVDAYSTGCHLAAAFGRRGWTCVHVQSAPAVIPHYQASFRPGEFTRNVIHDGSPVRVAEELAAAGVRHVLAGAESGVSLAEWLAARLGLPGNDPALPGARRDKSLMASQLRRHGLDAPAGIRATARAEALAWTGRHGRWPVVVKPVESAATDQVHVCEDAAAVGRAFDGILGATNVLGSTNDAALVQEFLAGVELAVNTVSHAGRHHVAEVWRYAKRPGPDGTVVYDHEEALPAAAPLAVVAAGYVCRALDALGVRNGPAHSEVMHTGRGPVLLETGARLPGMVLPAAMTACFGVSQVELTVDAVVDPDGFDRLVGLPYTTRVHLRNVFLVSPRDGVLARDDQFQLLRDVPAFAGMSLSVRAGTRLRRTCDLWSSPGHVALAHTEASAVAAGHDRIRELEATVLYPVGDALPVPHPHEQGSTVG